MEASCWGELAGRWHDLGKYSDAFQNYFFAQNGLEAPLEHRSRVDHSTAGAQHAVKATSSWGRLLAYVIAGHHAGLADATGGISSLDGRLKKSIEAFDCAPTEVVHAGVQLAAPPLTYDQRDRSRASFQVALFTRMLFSCLVDADLLATETFMNPNHSAERPTEGVALKSLLGVLDRFLNDLSAQSQPTDVNQRRAEVLAACRQQAAPIRVTPHGDISRPDDDHFPPPHSSQQLQFDHRGDGL